MAPIHGSTGPDFVRRSENYCRNTQQYEKKGIENSESGNNASKCRNHKVVHFLHMYWDQISNKDLQF